MKWTSETIYFMPKEDNSERRDQLPLRLNHRYPRILAIGILLLEVGLCKPFRTKNVTNKIAHINLDHRIAVSYLSDLKTQIWDGFPKKMYFDQAIEFCLNSEGFVTPSTVRPSPVVKELNQHEGMLMRRKMFYKHVVRPLAWLARTGFGTMKREPSYIHRSLDDPAADGNSTIVPQQGQSQSEAVFHSAKNAVPEHWLENLKAINAELERTRRRHGIRTRTKVAILDTGFNDTIMEAMEDESKLRCITHRKDFVGHSSASAATDTFGHGTFMARLVMECAPGAEVIVARVATCTKDLLTSQPRVAKVSGMFS